MADATQKDDPFHRDPTHRKIIVVNGPPGCGKDTASDAMRSFINIHANYLKPLELSFAEPLKKAAHALFDVFHPWNYYDSKEGRPQKGMACGDFLGLSPRQAYIEMSNKLIELHDDSALGFIMRKRIVRANYNSVIILDAGMAVELTPVIELVGQRNVLIMEIHTAGKDFESDSRSYIGAAVQEKFPHVQVMKIPNIIGDRGDLEIFRMLCQGTVKKFLKIEEKV